ncbi:YiiD C-terminal domain-containing protein [Pleomorphomonas sp. PLEO]|uniref:YiiD C-terminal domain-containing protein n=1 Tax=Pleomorphomonas sp. PLEO TaxID=3239306 RepID=UPI00351E9E3E
MERHDLESYLHEQIPLSQAVGVSVRSVTDGGVTLAAPLAPNINHKSTVFGGSASPLSILAAWSTLHVRLIDAGLRKPARADADVGGRTAYRSLIACRTVATTDP